MKTLYVDLDDTLIYTQYKFNQASVDCMKAINHFFGVSNPHPKAVVDHFIDLELDNASKFGFKKIRFANSWVETYRFFVERLDCEYDLAVEDQIFEIANQVNEPPFIMCDGADEAIADALKYTKDFFILTMGDESVQKAKIETLPSIIQDNIREIYVVAKKDTNTFKEIIGKRNPKDCVMIGNSLRSDIVPAVKTGAYAVHIPVETWTYDIHNEPIYYNKLYTIPSIKQLPNILKAINE